MNTSKNTKLTLIFIITVLLGFAAYALFFAPASDTHSGLENEEADLDDIFSDDTINVPATSTDVSVIEPVKKSSTVKKASIISKPQSVPQPAPAAPNNIPLPNLDRIVINTDLSPEQKQEYTGRMKDAATQIRENQSVYDNLLELTSYRKLVGDYTGAEEVWVYMTKKYTENRQPYEALGNLYHFYTKEYTKAEGFMKTAIEKEPQYPYSYVNLFELYTLSYTEKKNEAEKVLLDGLVKSPKSVLIELTLAKFYDGEGRDADARMRYENVLFFAREAGDTGLEAQVAAALEALK